MKTKKDISTKATEVTEVTVESSVNQNSIFKNVRKVSVMVTLTIAVIITAAIAIFTTVAVLAHTSSLRASEAEYDHLRGLAGDIESENNGVNLSALDIEMRQVNPDYVCWIRIDGTDISYPVVRGRDNEVYINTSFTGEKNKAGAIFMDYRNIGDPIPHIIIYGHNLHQGGMFTDLKKFLNQRFLEENNIITLIVNGNEVRFEIFSARLSDINDPAYDLDLGTPRSFARFADKIGAPLKATQIITLSTCSSRGDDDERVIIQGYRLFD